MVAGNFLTKTKHILIVDDEIHTLNALTIILSEAGYQVSESNNGYSALNSILSLSDTEEKIDLLLTDINMGGISGIELIKELKKKSIVIPIIAMSGNCSKQNLKELTDNIKIQYIDKPFESEDLLKIIKQAI